MNDCTADLEVLLADDEATVRRRSAGWYDQLAGQRGRNIVLFGAGGLGRAMLAGLRAAGVEPHAFADNSPRLWGKEIEGLPVLAPEAAACHWADRATFVVSVFSPGPGRVYRTLRAQLQALGCTTVVPFAAVAWKYPDRFLPNYCLDLPQYIVPRADEVRQGFALLADEHSRREYLAQLRWRLFLDYDVFPDPEARGDYFLPDLVAPRPDELFVDCGAFDGDTIRSFLGSHGDSFASITAFEPDPTNFEKLTAFHGTLPENIRRRIELHRAGVSRSRQKLRFAATGTAAAAVTEIGGCEIDCVPLDEMFDGRAPTFIKMDIEGAEPDALAGAAGLIGRRAPVLAICLYHCQDHLWRLPLQVRSLGEGYTLFVRRHDEDSGEVVCYAVPPGRLSAALNGTRH